MDYKKGVFVTQAQGISPEEPFIRSHKAYAEKHGLTHSIVTDIEMPPWMRERYANPYKFAKSFILAEALKGADYVLFAEADVMFTNLDIAPPVPRDGHWLRAGSCRSLEQQLCICPCLLAVVPGDAAGIFLEKSIELLYNGYPDGFPFDEALFHDTRKILNWPQWDMDSTLCGYHNGEYRDDVTRAWDYGDFALHISGVPWSHKLKVYQRTTNRPALQPGLSVVVAAQNLNTRLAATLPSWLNHPGVSELVVVDWASKTPFVQSLGPLMATSEKLRICRVDTDEPFNLGRAYNVGFTAARFDTTLKIDSDYLLADPGVIPALRENRAGGLFKEAILTGHHAMGVPELNGLVAGMTRALREVGYREDFTAWGHTDDDLYLRMLPFRREICRDLGSKVVHVPHPARQPLEAKHAAWAYNIDQGTRPVELPRRRYNRTGTDRVSNWSVVPPQPSARLKDTVAYSLVFEPFRGKKVWLHAPTSNVEGLFDLVATRQLFTHYEITEVSFEEMEVAMFLGSTDVGAAAAAQEKGLPTVRLPRAWKPAAFGDNYFDVTHLSETTMALMPGATMFGLPLAMAWQGPVWRPENIEAHGIFLRRDQWSTHNFMDPVNQRNTPAGYVSLAAGFQHLETDRVSFAIAGLLAGSKVTLLPDAAGENLGVYESWLYGYDSCSWAEAPSEQPVEKGCCCGPEA